RPVPDIPQPAPDSEITGKGVTAEEQSMLAQLQAQEAAAMMGPTDLALEAVQIGRLQTNDAIVGIVEETEGPRRHLEDLIEEVAECMTGVATQVSNCVTRLDRQRERLSDTMQRMEYLDSSE